MTIEVQITNKDKAKSLTVEIMETNRDSHERRCAYTQDIQPGLSATFYVHLLRDLLVREKLP